MNSSKKRPYITYALGEVFLVVIGILIALWINNWNEERKARQQERVLMEKLLIENQFNLSTLQEDEEERKNVTTTYYSFIEYLYGEEFGNTSDSLEYYLSSTLSTTTYTFAQNNLINFINFQPNNYSDLNKEIARLENIQNDLYQVSEQSVEPKIQYYYKALENDVDFITGEIYSTEILRSVAFRNNLLLITGVEEEISKKYFETLDQMRKVDSLITSYLKPN